LTILLFLRDIANAVYALKKKY